MNVENGGRRLRLRLRLSSSCRTDGRGTADGRGLNSELKWAGCW